MILCYNPTTIDETEIDRRVGLLLYKYDIFFIEDDDIYVSTENNQQILRIVLKQLDIKLFWVYSLKELPFTPTQISELIIYGIRSDIAFHSEIGDIYFSKMDDLDFVYPTVFEVFRDKSKQIPPTVS